MNGKSDFAVYNFKNGERRNTGFPIFVQGKPTFFVFVITPTSVIYSQIDKIISTERLEMFSLIVGTTVAIVILVVFLIRWSSRLDNEVKRRTSELNEVNNSLTESNTHLAAANEQLKVHDKMQKEFINIAVHELRIEDTNSTDFRIKSTNSGQNNNIGQKRSKRRTRAKGTLPITRCCNKKCKKAP
jgi:hypothetical protein